MNVVTLIGRLASDPVIREGEKTVMASFRLAVTRPFDKDKADFIQCKAFGKSAEFLGDYKSKGDEIAVSGRIETGSYPKKDGTMAYTTEIICDRVEATHGSKGAPKAEEPTGRESLPPEQMVDSFEQAEDDIPFK